MDFDEASLHERTEIFLPVRKYKNTSCSGACIDEISVDLLRKESIIYFPLFETAKNNYNKP
jgi:hypothetical protein